MGNICSSTVVTDDDSVREFVQQGWTVDESSTIAPLHQHHNNHTKINNHSKDVASINAAHNSSTVAPLNTTLLKLSNIPHKYLQPNTQISPTTNARQSLRSIQSRRRTRVSTNNDSTDINSATSTPYTTKHTLQLNSMAAAAKLSTTDDTNSLQHSGHNDTQNDGWNAAQNTPVFISNKRVSLTLSRHNPINDIDLYPHKLLVDDIIHTATDSKRSSVSKHIHSHNRKRDTGKRGSVLHELHSLQDSRRNSTNKLHRIQNQYKSQYNIFESIHCVSYRSYCIDISTCTIQQLNYTIHQLSQQQYINIIELRSLALVDIHHIQSYLQLLQPSLLQCNTICNLTITMSLNEMLMALKLLSGINIHMLTLQPTTVPCNHIDINEFIQFIHTFSSSMYALDMSSLNWPTDIIAQLYNVLYNKQLTHISLQSIQLHECTQQYLDIIFTNKHITHIDLCNIQFNEHCIRILAQHISDNQSVTHLLLDNIMSTSIASSLYCSLIHHNTAIQYISLASNHINTDGMYNLAKFIKNNTNLLYLNLNHNPLQFDGIRTFVDGITDQCQLHTLLLSDTQLTAHGSLFLTDTLIQHMSNKLQAIDLSYNNIEHPNQIIRLLTGCHKLTTCYYNDNNFGGTGKYKISHILQLKQREQLMMILCMGTHHLIGRHSNLQLFNTVPSDQQIHLYNELIDYTYGAVEHS